MATSTSETRWSRLVQDLEASGRRLREFAAEHDVNPNTLAWWRSHFRRRERQGRPAPAASSAFTELRLVACQQPDRSDHLVVTLDGRGAHVRVDRTTDLHLLRAVVEALC